MRGALYKEQKMNVSKEYTFSTKVNKDAQSKETKITLEWDVDQDTILRLASRAVIIEQQAIYRISGSIPAEDKVKVSEVLAAKKASRKPMSKEELVKKSLENPEVLASTMAALGMSKGQIAGTIGKKFPALSKDDLNALVDAAFSANEDDAAGEE